MKDSFSDNTFDIAIDGINGEISDSISLQKDSEIILCEFIEKLPHLNELDKHWAQKDTKESLENIPSQELSEKFQELKKKYQFYNFAGQLRKNICERAPGKNGKTVCNLIDSSILNISSEGKDRRWKLEELMTLNKATQNWKNEKNITHFKQRQEDLKDDVVSKILMLFDENFSEKFKKFQAKMGAPRFWTLFKEQRISPAELQNFTSGFQFKVPRDFLTKITQNNLATWPQKLKNLLIEDGKEILKSPTFTKTREQKLSKLTSAKSVADVLEAVLELKSLRDNREKELEKEDFIKMREENKAEEKRINEEKRKRDLEEESKLPDKKREEQEQKRKREEQEQKIKDREAESKEKGAELSEEKKLILYFYDKSIEHAEKVIEECSNNWGVGANDLEFWGQEGVKNRIHLLKKRGKWKDYVRFNSNDKHIPSNARGDGFRFRWLNVNTGSRISGASADSGIKYMQRYKESGYQLCVLAGAFSIDWAGSDSTVDTPARFLEKMKSLRGSLLGKTKKE